MTPTKGLLAPFLGVEELRPEAECRFVVLPVPYERTTSYMQGCASGPRAILAASAYVELFDEDAGLEPFRAGVFTAPPLLEPAAPEALPGLLREPVERWVRAGKFVATLGGEHAVTLGPVLGALAARPDLTVLQIDAHADLRDAFEGTPFSHACVMRRVQERCRVVQVGIRSLSAEEEEARPGLNVRTLFMRDTHPFGREHVAAALRELSSNVYLTVDIDGFDPAYAPATGTPEPGGLDWFEVSALVRELALSRRIVAMDVTEVRPEPGDVRTEFLAARLIQRTMAWVLRAEGKR
jgi:agmatinase